MAKAISALFSAIRGKAGILEFRQRKNIGIELGARRIPYNPKTQLQNDHRAIYGACIEDWLNLPENEKETWETEGDKASITGYNAFMQDCILAGPGYTTYEISIDNTANNNALAEYQIELAIENDPTFFDDCEDNATLLELFDSDETTPLPFWIEEWDTVNHNARIWIKNPSVPASATKKNYLVINTDRTEPLSNPGDTFLEFFDKDSTAGWTTSNLTVTTLGDDLRFFNTAFTKAGYAKRAISVPNEYALRAKLKNVSLGNNDQVEIDFNDTAASGTFAKINCPHRDHQVHWYYWPNEQEGGNWTEENYHIVETFIDEGNATTGIDYHVNGTEQNSKAFASGSPANTDELLIGDNTTDKGECDARFKFILLRKHTSPAPTTSYEKS